MMAGIKTNDGDISQERAQSVCRTKKRPGMQVKKARPFQSM